MYLFCNCSTVIPTSFLILTITPYPPLTTAAIPGPRDDNNFYPTSTVCLQVHRSWGETSPTNGSPEDEQTSSRHRFHINQHHHRCCEVDQSSKSRQALAASILQSSSSSDLLWPIIRQVSQLRRNSQPTPNDHNLHLPETAPRWQIPLKTSGLSFLAGLETLPSRAWQQSLSRKHSMRINTDAPSNSGPDTHPVRPPPACCANGMFLFQAKQCQTSQFLPRWRRQHLDHWATDLPILHVNGFRPSSSTAWHQLRSRPSQPAG